MESFWLEQVDRQQLSTMPHFEGNELVDDDTSEMEREEELERIMELIEDLDEAYYETGIRFANRDEMHKWYHSYYVKYDPLMDFSEPAYSTLGKANRKVKNLERKKSARQAVQIRNQARSSKKE